jgi:plasmid segregation oscillating ATPase ParF
MITVSIVSQKGGAGKTTLAIHLATAAHDAGIPTVIMDTDPQATASRWGKWRGGRDPDVIDCASHSLLPDKLAALERAGAMFAVIDTPPAADIMAREACRVASLLLIPCRPRAFDLDAVRTTAELAQASGKPAYVLFMAGPPRAALLYAEAERLIEQIGLKVAPVMLPERAAFHHSVAGGKTAPELEPAGKAADDVAALWTWVSKHDSLLSRHHVIKGLGV